MFWSVKKACANSTKNKCWWDLELIFYFWASFPTNVTVLTPTELHRHKSRSQEFRVRQLFPPSSPSSYCSGSAKLALPLSLTFSIRYHYPLWVTAGVCTVLWDPLSVEATLPLKTNTSPQFCPPPCCHCHLAGCVQVNGTVPRLTQAEGNTESLLLAAKPDCQSRLPVQRGATTPWRCGSYGHSSSPTLAEKHLYWGDKRIKRK